jgi:3-methyladenine DNA glycosylase AlkC
MQNPINKIKKYASNVDKELQDLGNSNMTYSRNKTKANKNKVQTQRSEFFGALFQGRRYDAGVKTTTKTVNKVYRPMGN